MELPEFLVAAKQKMWAADVRPLALVDGGEEFTYTWGYWKYLHRWYAGKHSLSGHELVWRHDELHWGMNCLGGIRIAGTEVGPVYECLKLALREVNNILPFRGPAQFKALGLEYYMMVGGTVKRFKGYETIGPPGIKVYRLDFHGGLLSSLNI